jgi:hypothetical protein
MEMKNHEIRKELYEMVGGLIFISSTAYTKNMFIKEEFSTIGMLLMRIYALLSKQNVSSFEETFIEDNSIEFFEFESIKKFVKKIGDDIIGTANSVLTDTGEVILSKRIESFIDAIDFLKVEPITREKFEMFDAEA